MYIECIRCSVSGKMSEFVSLVFPSLKRHNCRYIMKTQEITVASDIRTFFKQWPKFYYFIMVVFGPILFTGLSAKGFLKKYQVKGKILNLGSGPRIISKEVVNVDIHPYVGVDMVADICAVPLPSGSVQGLISENMLEHVESPERAVSEMYRLLAPRGVAYIEVPFLYPFHASPSDFHRWSKEGLRKLFGQFEIIEIGVRGGPFSALNAFLCHFVGSLFSFGSDRLYSLFTNLVMFIFFPIKYLDIIFAYIPNAVYVAADLYCVIRKK